MEQQGLYLPEFERDLLAIKSRDIWNAKMDNITLYAYERKSAKVDAVKVFDEFDQVSNIKIRIDDELPDSIYNQPLSVKVKLPIEWKYYRIQLTDSAKIYQTLNYADSNFIFSILPNNQNYYLQPIN